MFTLTYNGTAASVICVSSRSVVLTLDLTISCGAHKQNKALRNKETRNCDAFSQSWTQTLNSCRSLSCARDNESIIYVPMIETYINDRKKPQFSSYPAANHTKHSKFAITDIWEKPVDFFIARHGRRLWLLTNFTNSGSFAKVSVPVESIISGT